MKRSKYLEDLVTKHLIATVVLVVILTVGMFGAILSLKLTQVNTLASFVDATFKTIAIIAGAIWTLNRYYIGRIDVNQLKVDAEVSVIPADSFVGNSANLSLLVYRIDVVNTGKSLIPDFSEFLEIDSVTPELGAVREELLYRWPTEGMHPGGSIEPGSWSAINQAVPIPAEVRVVRFYLEFHMSDKTFWTWHKTFDISRPEDKKSLATGSD